LCRYYDIVVTIIAHEDGRRGGTMHQSLRQELQNELLQHALRFGDFTLTSGRKSDYYIDGKQTTLRARGLFLVAKLLVAELQPLHVDAFGGPTLGADPVVGAVIALAAQDNLPLRGFIVRKEPKHHGTQQCLEGPLEPGMRVAIFDDVVTTGGSLKHAIDQVETAQCAVVKVLAIVDRQEGASENFAQWGYPFQALFTIDELRAARLA
jgi:orotate phosphoribosyltransferase